MDRQICTTRHNTHIPYIDNVDMQNDICHSPPPPSYHRCDKDGQVDYHELTLQLSRSTQARKLADPHLASLTGRDYADPRGKK